MARRIAAAMNGATILEKPLGNTHAGEGHSELVGRDRTVDAFTLYCIPLDFASRSSMRH